MNRFDVIVIGAGPAGSSAAVLLAKAGRNVALVEKATFPRRKVCGEYISAATLPLLDACGIGDEFARDAGPLVTHVGFYAGHTMVDAPLPAGGGRALGRDTLDTLLLRLLQQPEQRFFPSAFRTPEGVLQAPPPPAASPRGGGEVTALHRTAGGYRVCIDGRDDIEAAIIIAACGSWNVKGPFALDPPPKETDMLAFKAHFTQSHLPAGLMPLLAFPGGYGGMVHQEGGRISLSCCIRRDTLAAARRRHGGRAAEALFAHIGQTTRGAAAALDGAEPDGAFLSAGPIRPGIRPRFSGGIFFTGNLAGEAHPVIAEGISMAVQASSLLAGILIAEPDVGRAGAVYARAWRRRFAPRLYTSTAIAQLAMYTGPRGFSAFAVRHMPRLLTFGAGLAGKTL